MPKGKKHKGQKKAREVLQLSTEKGEQEEGSVTSESAYSEDLEHQLSEESSPECEEELFSESDEISDLIDQLVEKNSKTRLSAIAKLNKLFTTKYVGDLLSGNLEFLTDALARGLRRAGGNERVELCRLLMLLSAQVGEEVEVMASTLNQMLITIAKDPSVRIGERSCCLSTAGILSYLVVSDPKDLALLAEEFTRFLSLKDDVALLCRAALTSWSLLLSVCHHPAIVAVVREKTPLLLALLESRSLEVKISAGQAVALLFELVPQDCESVDDEWSKCVEKLESLAGENPRHVERKERTHQRVSFRDIHQSVESGYVSEQKVSIHHEKVMLDSWARIMQYNAIKELLGAGTATHMKENPFLRETFGLPPVHEKQSLEARISESREKVSCSLSSLM
jgi:hypothetical protein